MTVKSTKGRPMFLDRSYFRAKERPPLLLISWKGFIMWQLQCRHPSSWCLSRALTVINMYHRRILGGALNKVSYGKLRPEVQTPTLSYTIFDRKGTPNLSYTFHRKLYPFHIPTERLFLNFSLEKPLKILERISC